MFGTVTSDDRGTRRLRPRGGGADRPVRDVPIRAIDRGGALTATDGAIVRALELTPQSTLAAASEQGEELRDGVAELLGRLDPGESLQWYAESRPLAGAELAPSLPEADRLGRELSRTLAEDAARVERHAPHPAGFEQTLHVLVRTPPEGVRRLARAGAAPGPLGSVHRRALERSLERVERLSLALSDLGLRPRLLDGPGMSRLLLRRLRTLPAQGGEPRVEVVGALDERAEAQRSIAAAGRLLDLLRGVAVDYRDDRRVAVGGQLEQAIALGAAPAQGARDWLAPLLAGPQRHAASIHVRAREDGMLDLGVHVALVEGGPTPDAVRLATAVDDAVRAGLSGHGVRIDRGEFTQRELWPATLPLAAEPHDRGHRVDVRVAAEALPLVGDRCGSPGGVAFGRAGDGRLERLDPWDLAHRHSAVLVAGGSARERAEVVAALAARLAGAGHAVRLLDGEGALAERCAPFAGTRQLTVETALDGVGPGRGGRDRSGTDRGGRDDVGDGSDGDTSLLARAGVAAARLSEAVDPLLDGDDDGARGVLAIAGAERLLREPGGAEWLRRTAAGARRDRCCLLLSGIELAPFADAGLLGVVPVRILLSHPPRAAAALGERLELSARELRALVRDAEAAPETPLALWLNGDRGRALVRLLELPRRAAEEEAAA